MSLNSRTGDDIDYITIARQLMSMPPPLRWAIYQAVNIMKSRWLRAALVIGSLVFFVGVMVWAASAKVSPALAWALVSSGGLLLLVALLKYLKIL